MTSRTKVAVDRAALERVVREVGLAAMVVGFVLAVRNDRRGKK